MKRGICPVCQTQQNVKFDDSVLNDFEDYQEAKGMPELAYILEPHNHAGGELCDGSGCTPQALVELSYSEESWEEMEEIYEEEDPIMDETIVYDEEAEEHSMEEIALSSGIDITEYEE